MKGSTSTIQRLLLGLTVVVVVLGGFLIASDWGSFRAVLGEAEWRPVVFALLFTAVSYACISYSFARVSELLGIRMTRRALTEVGYISTVINHIVQSGGAAGYSVRYGLMQRHGVTMNDTLAASIYHFYLTSLAMLAMLPVGFAYLLLNAQMEAAAAALIGLATLLLIAVFVIATVLLFADSVRAAALAATGRIVRSLAKRDIRPVLATFDDTMHRGLIIMRRQPRSLLLIMILVFVDWTASAMVLWFCFDALGLPPQPGVLLSGFVIGIVAGVLSTIPAGIGVQEGTMAGIYALLGMPIEQSILAAILFRGVYNLIPYAVSLVIYGRLLRQMRQEPTLAKEEMYHAFIDDEPRLSSDG